MSADARSVLEELNNGVRPDLLTNEEMEVIRSALSAASHAPRKECCGLGFKAGVSECPGCPRASAASTIGKLEGWEAALKALARNECAEAYSADEPTHLRNIIANLRRMVKDAQTALTLSVPSATQRSAEPVVTDELATFWAQMPDGATDSMTAAGVKQLAQAYLDSKDDCLRLHREKVDALYGTDGFPRSETSPKTGAVMLVHGKPHRLCDCDPHKGECPRGIKRTLATTDLSRCLIPAPDILIVAADGGKQTA